MKSIKKQTIILSRSLEREHISKSFRRVLFWSHFFPTIPWRCYLLTHKAQSWVKNKVKIPLKSKYTAAKTHKFGECSKEKRITCNVTFTKLKRIIYCPECESNCKIGNNKKKLLTEV